MKTNSTIDLSLQDITRLITIALTLGGHKVVGISFNDDGSYQADVEENEPENIHSLGETEQKPCCTLARTLIGPLENALDVGEDFRKTLREKGFIFLWQLVLAEESYLSAAIGDFPYQAILEDGYIQLIDSRFVSELRKRFSEQVAGGAEGVELLPFILNPTNTDFVYRTALEILNSEDSQGD